MTSGTVTGDAFGYVDNRYYDGPHYDRRYADYTRDVEFWCALARETGPRVLELAAGTGRLALPIARCGLSVVGLDIAPAMLERARAKVDATTRATFLTGDMRDFALAERFDLVFIACSSVCHLLTVEDVRRCFATVRRHVRSGGRFALDVAAPHRETATADGTWRPRFRYPDPGGPGEVVVRGRRRYDPATAILTDDLDYEFTADGHVERATRVSRMYPYDELVALLDGAGFDVVSAYGDFDRGPLSDGSATQVLVCAPRPEPAP